MTRSNSDLLHAIYLKLRKVETDPAPAHFSEIEKSWEDLSPSYPKLYELKRVFKNGWNSRKISDLLIAFERAMNQTLVETEFLVTTQDSVKSKESFPLEIALDSIRSAFNVGGFLRTAEAFGVSHIHFLGYTPLPTDLTVKKTALGTEGKIPFTQWPSRDEFYKAKNTSHFLVSMETSEKAIDLTEPWPRKPTILIFGNERFGLDHTSLSQSHETRRIPLFGEKNSLNVVVSSGVAIHEWLRQWRQL